MTSTQQQLAHRAEKQLKELSMYFESITDLDLRQEIVNFMMKIGDAAGFEINHETIKSTLASEEVFEGMFGRE